MLKLPDPPDSPPEILLHAERVIIDDEDDEGSNNNHIRTQYGSMESETNGSTTELGAGSFEEQQPSSASASSESPPLGYRDLMFSVLFGLQLFVMVILSILFGHYAMTTTKAIETTVLRDDDEALRKFDAVDRAIERYIKKHLPQIFFIIMIPCAVAALILAVSISAFLIPFDAVLFAQSSLVSPVIGIILFLLAVAATSTPSGILTVMMGVTLLGVVYTVRKTWRYIPFAAANLKVAVQCINSNWGIYMLAVVFSIVGFLWNLFWVYTTAGVLTYENLTFYQSQQTASKSGFLVNGSDPIQITTVIFLIVSLYWTGTVLLNTVQVTVAGLVATWCYDELEARTFCSPAVTESLQRSSTFSFGSICLGSLFQGIVVMLRSVVHTVQTQRKKCCGCCCSILCCLPECLVVSLQEVVGYFSQWAYVFVGVYGDPYIESGRKVRDLFVTRGWEKTVVTNGFVGYVLNFAIVIIGVGTGVVAVVLHSLFPKSFKPSIFGDIPGEVFWCFGLGLIVGVTVSSVTINVIKGAVNTLIVCFADSPSRLEDNHPEAVEHMAAAWSEVFPETNVQSRLQYSTIV